MVSRKPEKTSLKPRHTIFVTGATGYLGGHFLEASKNESLELRCLVRKIPRLSYPNVRWVRGDIRRPANWRKTLKGCDAVLHLATIPLTESEKDPIFASEVIVGGIKNLIEEGVRNKISRYIIGSTAEVYGSPQKLPVKETESLSPLSIYGYLKACADLYALSKAQNDNLQITILRIFNIYGPRADGTVPPLVFRSFAEQLIAGKPIILHASQKNSRDFIYITDVAKLLVNCIQKPRVHGVFNIGSGEETALKDLASRISKILDKKLKIDFRPEEGRKRRLAANISLARKKIGFHPKVSLDQGLHEVLKALLKEKSKKL
jgi:UDP-glucose 4-epimerase